jgi:anti-sigma regulatory factor (Ser/Thr protein kinase)
MRVVWEVSTLREGGGTVAEALGVRQGSWTSVKNLSQLSSLEFGGLAGAVPCARLHTRQVLWERGLDSVADTVELLVSELVTNAVQASLATGELLGILLRLFSDGAMVLVEVWDQCAELPLPRDNSPASERGRGLMLVDVLAADWGWYEPSGWPGKAVWCLIRPPVTGRPLLRPGGVS